MHKTHRDLEDELLIWYWGNWARPRIERDLGYPIQPWVREMKRDAWAETKAPQRISDEYGMAMDRLILKLEPEARSIIISIYCYRVDIHKLERKIRKSKHVIRNIRNACLNQIHGAIYLLPD